MTSQTSSLRLRYIDKHTTYSFSFEGCDNTFEWVAGTARVLEHPQGDEEANVIVLGPFCVNLELVVKFVRKYKEEEQN